MGLSTADNDNDSKETNFYDATSLSEDDDVGDFDNEVMETVAKVKSYLLSTYAYTLLTLFRSTVWLF